MLPPLNVGDVVENVIGLGSQDAREIWEDLFNKTYIQPVLEVCNHVAWED